MDPVSPPSPSQQNDIIKQLQAQLLAEKQKGAWLTKELERMKQDMAELSRGVEAEEECITNRMMKRLMELKKEKETLAVEVEREEELLTNTLQRKLTQVRQEKVDLEVQLEREQEYIVNKLHKQLDQLKAEKERMALEVEIEEEYLTNTMGKKMDILQAELVQTQNHLTESKEEVVNIRGKAAKGVIAALDGVRKLTELCSNEDGRTEASEGVTSQIQHIEAQLKSVLTDIAPPVCGETR